MACYILRIPVKMVIKVQHFHCSMAKSIWNRLGIFRFAAKRPKQIQKDDCRKLHVVNYFFIYLGHNSDKVPLLVRHCTTGARERKVLVTLKDGHWTAMT
jgi:hypothetical protein